MPMSARFVLPCAVLGTVAIIAQLVASGCEQTGGDVQTPVDAEVPAVTAQDQPASATGKTVSAVSEVSKKSDSPHAAQENPGDHKHTNRLINQTSPS